MLGGTATKEKQTLSSVLMGTCPAKRLSAMILLLQVLVDSPSEQRISMPSDAAVLQVTCSYQKSTLR